MSVQRISNEEYDVAYSDKMNRKIMWSVAKRFRDRLTYDETLECMQIALLRTMNKHEHGRQKFTTSLWKYTFWSCQNAVRDKGRQKQFVSIDDVPDIETPTHPRQLDIDHISECISMLKKKDKDVIEQYYLQSMTFEEIGVSRGHTKEGARKSFHRAMKELRRICLLP